MLKHLVHAGLAVLILTSLASASMDPLEPSTAQPVAAESAAPAESEVRFTPEPEYRIPPGGCEAMVWCPGGGFVRCVSWAANGCVERPDGTPPWVACDAVVHSCPAPLE